MRILRRIIAASVAFFLLVVLVGPFLLGLLVRQHYKQGVARLAQAGYMQVTTESYRLGWLDSDIVTRVVIPLTGDRFIAEASSDIAGQFSFTIRHKVEHGPVIHKPDLSYVPAMYAITSVLDSTGDVKKALGFYFPEHDYLRIYSTMGYDGFAQANIFSPAYSGPLKDNRGNLQWEGIAGELTISDHSNHIAGTVNLPKFVIETVQGKFSLDNVSIHTDLYHLDGPLWGGGQQITLTRASMAGNGGTTDRDFSLHNLKLDLKQDASGTFFNVAEEIKIDDILFGSQRYRNGQFNLAIRNVDYQLGLSLMDEYNALLSKPSLKRQQFVIDVDRLLEKYIPQILSRGPIVELSNVGLTTESGDMMLDFLVSGFEHLDYHAVADNPREQLSRLRFVLKLKAPVSFVETQFIGNLRSRIAIQNAAEKMEMSQEAVDDQANNAAHKMLFNLEQVGMIRRDDGHYSVELNYDSQHLLLNGRNADGLKNSYLQYNGEAS